jgi:hypothetical protein
MRLLRVDELSFVEGGAGVAMPTGRTRKTNISSGDGVAPWDFGAPIPSREHVPFQPPIVETHRSWDDRGWWNLEPRYWSLAR